MGNTLCLQSIMNEVGAHIAPAPSPVVTELQAFLQIDPLLARLHKEYLDAKDTRCKSEKDFGKNDPMTDMALLVEDSAWCAMQTRYMEVRADRALMAQALSLIEDERIKANRKREAKNAEAALRLYHYMDFVMRARRKEMQHTGWIWAIMLLLQEKAFSFRVFQPTHQFNRLAA